jgi:hypothetical protein
MASYRICYGSAAAAFFLVLQASAFAQGKGTQQQRDACTPDAMRLCGAYLLDAGRVEACLRASGPNLSRPCYDVFFPPQQASVPQPAARQRRSNNPPLRLQPRPPANDDED